MATERQGAVTLKGNPLTLIGEEIKVGDKAPDFTTLAALGSPVTLADLGDDIKVFNVVLSLDTPICDAQTRRFNEEAASLPDNVKILTVSMDLPFAAKRFCEAAGIERVKTVSDYKDASFGERSGYTLTEIVLFGYFPGVYLSVSTLCNGVLFPWYCDSSEITSLSSHHSWGCLPITDSIGMPVRVSIFWLANVVVPESSIIIIASGKVCSADSTLRL